MSKKEVEEIRIKLEESDVWSEEAIEDFCELKDSMFGDKRLVAQELIKDDRFVVGIAEIWEERDKRLEPIRKNKKYWICKRSTISNPRKKENWSGPFNLEELLDEWEMGFGNASSVQTDDFKEKIEPIMKRGTSRESD